MSALTQKRLKEVLHYSVRTGIFTWKTRLARRIHIGDVAGSHPNSQGYTHIAIDGIEYKAHRLAWLYVYGEWPDGEIDHKNTVKHHNWIKNLRDLTRTGNKQNTTKAYTNNKTGLLGVSFNKESRNFIAKIMINGKTKTIGRYLTPELAHKAYVKAKRKYHKMGTL